MGAKLTAAQKNGLLRDGYVVLPKLVPPAPAAAALRQINHRLGTGRHPGLDEYSKSLPDYISERGRDAALLALASGGMRSVVESLLGAKKVEPVSEAQTALRFPSRPDDPVTAPNIHIDLPGPRGGPPPAPRTRYTLCVGVLLNDQPRPDMGNLTVYPGSHRAISGVIREKGLDAFRPGITDGLALPEPVQVTGKTGDAVLFHFLTAHSVARNASPAIRYNAYFRFWHVDAWYDQSQEYLLKALSNPWLEWAGLRGRA
jgi:hypothetical protein